MCTENQLKAILDRVAATARTALGDRLHSAYLYGSYARGDYDAESDVDILVLADVPREKLAAYKKPFLKATSDLGLEYDIVVTVTLKLGDYKTVANRSYYAVFAAMRAVLALQGFDSKKHSGIIAEFRREYIKSGLLPKELSPIIEALVEIRQGSDYDDFYLISKEEVEEQLHNAEQFVRIVETYLLTQYSKST